MSDGLALTWDATRLLSALDLLTSVVQKAELEACRLTAENIAREARARAARRGPNPTKAQLARPPIEQLIRVEPMRNGTGSVVIVQVPGEDPYLPWQLDFGTRDMEARKFFFVSATLEKPAHLRRVNEAAQAALDALSGGGG